MARGQLDPICEVSVVLQIRLGIYWKIDADSSVGAFLSH